MIKLGTSGFSFRDWKGTVYPKKLSPKEYLRYYQEDLGFDCVEINSTYYALVSERSFEGMERKTGPGFAFSVKAYRGITHDPFDDRLKKDKPALSRAREDIKKFIYSLGPLIDARKLGAVLLQFPVFFYPSRENFDYLAGCREWFKGLPLAVEFRNVAWTRESAFSFLKKEKIAYCAVDEPHLPRLMPFVGEVTADIGYIRLHGRNRNWFNEPTSTRYNYLYSDGELKELLPEIKSVAKKADTTYVFFNNCHAGLAVKNAFTLRQMLGLKPAHALLV